MKMVVCSVPASMGESMTAVADKLSDIAGTGKLVVREYRVRSRLNWHTKAKTAVRHILQGEQHPTPDEAKEIEAAHIRWCAEKIDANRRENAKLFDLMRQAIAAMEASDPAFHGPQIEALRELLDHDWNMGADKIEKA